MPRNKVMKIYAWEACDALTDYYPGLAVALASTVKEAREAVALEYHGSSARAAASRAALVEELAKEEPHVTRLAGCRSKRPIAWAMNGGG
jgi:hypothetical protein